MVKTNWPQIAEFEENFSAAPNGNRQILVDIIEMLSEKHTATHIINSIGVAFGGSGEVWRDIHDFFDESK